jgi:hypothetical protein
MTLLSVVLKYFIFPSLLWLTAYLQQFINRLTSVTRHYNNSIKMLDVSKTEKKNMKEKWNARIYLCGTS